MNPREETTAGVERFGSGSLIAYRSLARAAGVSIDVVLAHARNDTLKALIRGSVEERRVVERICEREARLVDWRIREAKFRAAYGF